MSLPGPHYTHCDDVDLVRQVSVESTHTTTCNSLEEALDSCDIDSLLALDSNDVSVPVTSTAPVVDMAVVDDAVESLLAQAQKQQYTATSNPCATAHAHASRPHFGRRHSMGSVPMPAMPSTMMTAPHLQVAAPGTLEAIDVAPLNVFHRDQFVRVSDDDMSFNAGLPDTRPPLGRRHSLHSPSHIPALAQFQRQQEQLPYPFYDEVTTVQVFPAAQQQQKVAASAMGVAGNQIITSATSIGMASPHKQMAACNWPGNAGSDGPATPATTAPSTRTCSPSSGERIPTALPQDDIFMPIPFQLQNDAALFNERAHHEDLRPLDLQDFPLEGVDQADLFDTFEALPHKVSAAPTRPSLLATQQTSCRSLDGHHHSDGTLTLVQGASTNISHVDDLDREDTSLPSSNSTTGTNNTTGESSPSMDRLRALMAKSIESMKRLEEHDRRQGLRKCDAQNMMNTARSRKQILENRILKKWDGTPLIAFEKCKTTGSITVSAGPKKERMTKRRASLAGKAIHSIQDRRRMARRSSM